MQLQHLRYLQEIARLGSLSAAARSLRVSQPTLTGAVQGLERELQTTLLLRGRNGVQLTEAGQVVLRHAGEILLRVEMIEQEVRGVESELRGRFVIGCHESLGAYFLPGFMGEFMRAAPGVELTLWNGTSAAVQEAVVAHKVHLGLVVNPLPQPELVMVRLFLDAMDLFVRAEDRVEISSLDDAWARIARGPLVFAGRVAQCQELLQQLGQGHRALGRVLSCGDLELVKSLTLAGLGVGVLPRRVAAYSAEGKLARLHEELPCIPDTIYLVYREDLHRTRAVLRVKDALVEHGRRLPQV